MCRAQVFEDFAELADAACACVYALPAESDWGLAGHLMAAAEEAVQAHSVPRASKHAVNEVQCPAPVLHHPGKLLAAATGSRKTCA